MKNKIILMNMMMRFVLLNPFIIFLKNKVISKLAYNHSIERTPGSVVQTDDGWSIDGPG